MERVIWHVHGWLLSYVNAACLVGLSTFDYPEDKHICIRQSVSHPPLSVCRQSPPDSFRHHFFSLLCFSSLFCHCGWQQSSGVFPSIWCRSEIAPSCQCYTLSTLTADTPSLRHFAFSYMPVNCVTDWKLLFTTDAEAQKSACKVTSDLTYRIHLHVLCSCDLANRVNILTVVNQLHFADKHLAFGQGFCGWFYLFNQLDNSHVSI